LIGKIHEKVSRDKARYGAYVTSDFQKQLSQAGAPYLPAAFVLKWRISRNCLCRCFYL